MSNLDLFNVGKWKCSVCSDILDSKKVDVTGRWRWTGEEWEHKCEMIHSQAGHMPAERLRGER